MSRYLPDLSVLAPIRPLKRKVLAFARPGRTKLPGAGTRRVHLGDLRLREVTATHRPPVMRPGRDRATVNRTAASLSSTKLTFVPTFLLAPITLGPLRAARNELGDTFSALTVASGGGTAGGGCVTGGGGGGHPFSVPATVWH